MAYPHCRSQFGGTTLTKVFVGGLAWETSTEEMHKYFEQFGEILEAVIINEKHTGKSKGYGFVTFREPESAKKACAEPNPMIDRRRANCNIAALGRPCRPSSPSGRNQGGNPYQVGARQAATSPRSSYAIGGIPTQSTATPTSLQPPPPLLYSPYEFQPDYAFHHPAPYSLLQQPPYYHHHPVYGTTAATASPYYFGYSPLPRGTYGAAPAAPLRPPAPSYLYYPHPVPPAAEPSAVPALSAVAPFQLPPPPTLQPVQHIFPPPTDSQQTTPQSSSTEQQTAVPTSASSSEGLTL